MPVAKDDAEVACTNNPARKLLILRRQCHTHHGAWAIDTHRRQLLDRVSVQQQLFESSFMAKDVLWDESELTIPAIDPVDLPGAVEPDAGFEHDQIARSLIARSGRSY